MRLILILILLNVFSAKCFAAKICYFSLNNSNEFMEMKKFTSKLNEKLDKDTEEKIEIVEFLTPGENAEMAFQKMIDSKVKCDGLVISGHHTGAFGGKNSPSTLSVDFMEKLSCNPKNKEFFNYIKALWLQGCRTLGVGKIESYESADYHTERVGNVLDEDGLRQSFAELNMEFSETLDKDNPLSSRYLRIFPRATTFGWTKTAPGVDSKSEYSIPFHIANIARLNDDRGRYFDNPVGEQISSESAVIYLLSLDKLLGTKLSSPFVNPCQNLRDETLSTKAWINHGLKGPNNPMYSFSIPDLNAYEALFKTNNELLLTAKTLECYLKNSSDVNSILPVIDQILKNEALIGYSFNSIHELILRFRLSGDIAGLVQLQDKLKASSMLQNFLMRKLASNELGILRKIDYYAFWKELSGESSPVVEELINQAFLKMAFTPLKEHDYHQQDFIETLFQSMAKHGFLTSNNLEIIISKGNSFLLQMTANNLGSSPLPIEGSDQLFNKILKSDKADKNVLSAVANAIGNSKSSISGAKDVLKNIVKSNRADEFTLSSVAVAVANSQTGIEGANEILKEIVSSPTAKEETLRSVASSLKNSKNPIANPEVILNQILDSKKANAKTLSSILLVIKDSQVASNGAEDILNRIVKSDLTNEQTLSDLAETLGNTSSKLKSPDLILQKIMNSNYAGEKTLRSVAEAVGNSKNSINNAHEVLSEIVNNEKSNWMTLKSVAHTIGISKDPINDPEVILKMIVNSDKANYSTLSHVAYVIGISQTPINAPEEILDMIMKSKNSNQETFAVVADTRKKLGLPQI